MRNEDLIVGHMKYACKLARITQRRLPVHVELVDLESEAMYGLVRGGRLFDRDLWNKDFSTFITYCVVGVLRDHLDKNSQRSFYELTEANGGSYVPELGRWIVLDKAMAVIPARVADILRRRYLAGETCEAIAGEIGLSYGRVAQLSKWGLQVMRRTLEVRGVRKVADVL